MEEGRFVSMVERHQRMLVNEEQTLRLCALEQENDELRQMSLFALKDIAKQEGSKFNISLI